MSDLTKLAQLAEQHSSSYASPHHFVLSVAGLRSIIEDLAAQPGAVGDMVMVPAKNNDVDRLLRQVFLLCEAVEDLPEIDPKNEHERGFDRGRRFQAKQIRRAIGDWFQWTFCGSSFMGEPVLAAAPTEAKPAQDALRDAPQADALNTLCKMMHGGEEVEGDDGLAMLVPMDLWNEAQEAIELLVGEDDATEEQP